MVFIFEIIFVRSEAQHLIDYELIPLLTGEKHLFR